MSSQAGMPAISRSSASAKSSVRLASSYFTDGRPVGAVKTYRGAHGVRVRPPEHPEWDVSLNLSGPQEVSHIPCVPCLGRYGFDLREQILDWKVRPRPNAATDCPRTCYQSRLNNFRPERIDASVRLSGNCQVRCVAEVAKTSALQRNSPPYICNRRTPPVAPSESVEMRSPS